MFTAFPSAVDSRNLPVIFIVLLLSNPHLSATTVKAAVGTAQVAPTILRALGLDPRALDAVRIEGTDVLPAVQLDK